MSNELELGRIGSEKAPVIIKLNNYKGNDLIDIRKYYQDKEGKLRPKRKGIALSRKTIYPALKLIAENIDKINKFFDVNEADIAGSNIEELNTGIEIKEEIDSHDFFKVEMLGSEKEIKLNSTHPFGKLFEGFLEELSSYDEELKDQLVKLIGSLFVSYFNSVSQVDAKEQYDAESLFFEHKINWSSYLKRELNDI